MYPDRPGSFFFPVRYSVELLSLDGKSMPIDGDLYEAAGSLTFQEDGSLRLLVVKDNMLSKVVVASR